MFYRLFFIAISYKILTFLPRMSLNVNITYTTYTSVPHNNRRINSVRFKPPRYQSNCCKLYNLNLIQIYSTRPHDSAEKVHAVSVSRFGETVRKSIFFFIWTFIGDTLKTHHLQISQMVSRIFTFKHPDLSFP